MLKYLSKTKHVQGTPTILDRGLDNSKNNLGACQRILKNFFPPKVYILINKSWGIHILKFGLKKSCPGDDGTILVRMSQKPLLLAVWLRNSLTSGSGQRTCWDLSRCSGKISRTFGGAKSNLLKSSASDVNVLLLSDILCVNL